MQFSLKCNPARIIRFDILIFFVGTVARLPVLVWDLRLKLILLNAERGIGGNRPPVGFDGGEDRIRVAGLKCCKRRRPISIEARWIAFGRL